VYTLLMTKVIHPYLPRTSRSGSVMFEPMVDTFLHLLNHKSYKPYSEPNTLWTNIYVTKVFFSETGYWYYPESELKCCLVC